MQIIQQFGATVRYMAFGEMSPTVTMQNAFPEYVALANKLFFLPLGSVCGIGAVLIILVLCIVLIRRSRWRLLVVSQKCERLGSELGETTRELEHTNDLFQEAMEQHGRQLEESAAAVFKLNEQGECVNVNQAMETLSGFSKDHLLKRGLIDVVHPDDRAAVRDKWHNFASAEVPCESAYRLQREDGSIVYVAARGSVLRDKDGSVTGYFGLLMDVSEREYECQKIERAGLCHSRFFHQAADSVYELRPDEPISVDQPAEKVAELIFRQMKLVSCSSGLAAFYGRSADELSGTVLQNLPGGCGLLGNAHEIEQFVSGGLNAVGVEKVCTDCHGTPLYLRNDVVGVVEDGQLICILGAQYDLSEQKREKEQSEQQMAFFRRILNTLPGDVFVKDSRCRYLYVSGGFEDHTGIPVDDWMEKTVFEVLPAVPRDFNATSIEAMKSGAPCSKVALRPGSNEEEWVETIENPLVSNDGVIEGVVGISIDVTERAWREQALQQSESLFRYLVEQNPAGIMMADGSTRRVSYANPAFCDFFGYTEDEVRDLTVGDLHSPGSRQQVLDEWDGRARREQQFDDVLSCQRKDRSVVFADVEVSSAQLAGTEQTIGVYSNAAGRKKTEAALEQQRDALAGILRNASMLVATVDSSGRIRSANDALLELVGQDETELVGRPYADLVFKEDRERLKEAFTGRGSDRTECFEYRLLSRAGALFTVNCRIRARENTSGFTVAGLDVSELRVLEQQLREECGELRGQLKDRDSELAAAVATRQESKQLCDKLVGDLRQQEQTQEKRVQGLNDDLEACRKREAALHETVGELNRQKSELEETLETRQEELGRQTAQCCRLEDLLKTTREEFAAERETFTTESQQTISSLNEELQVRRTREEELAAECERLDGHLAEIKTSLQVRSQEMETLCSEWKAKEGELVRARDELAERTEQQSRQLEQAVSERGALDDELSELRKKASACQVQVEEKTASLRLELDEVSAREQQLTAAQAEADGQLAELKKELSERTSELMATLASCKEQGEMSSHMARMQEELDKRSAEVSALLKTRKELEDMVELEKESLAHRIRLCKEEMQENRRAQQVWQEREKELQETIQAVKGKLARREQDAAQEADARRAAEQETERLRKAVEEDGRRVCDLAEDLTVPLTPVLTLSAAVLEEPDVPKKERSRLKKINRCGQRMQSILDYQKELFRLENGGVKNTPESVDFIALLTSLVDEYTEKANEKRLFFALSRSDNLPVSVRVDPAGLRRVLDALVDHALKKTPGKGRVGLHVACEKREEGSSRIVFLLVYSSLDQDAVVTGGLFDSGGCQKSVREMNAEELPLSLTRHYAELLGGSLCLQEPSELTKRLSFSLPVVCEPDRELPEAPEPDLKSDQLEGVVSLEHR